MEFISCGLGEFLKEYQGKKIVCFGGGSYFQVLLYDLRQREANIEIGCVIDNDERKSGARICFQNDSIEILSLGRAHERFDLRQLPVLITSASHRQILEQLKKLPYFQVMRIYSYYDLKKNDTEEYTLADAGKKIGTIPKTIHYCWFGGNKIPGHLQKCIDSWKFYCPEYEIVKWNEENYDVGKNFFMRTALKKKKWGFLPDFARLDIIYENGGIYLDTDVELVKSVDGLRSNEAFFCTEVTGGINEGSGFGAAKGNPLVGRLREIYQELNEETPFLFNTCLGKEIGVFYDFGYQNNGRFQLLDDKTAIYPFPVMSPYIKETGETRQTTATVGIHHFDGSWC